VSADPSGEEPSGGRLRPTSAGALTGWGVAGLVGGWLLHPLTVRWRGSAPIVTWAQPLALILVAAILGATAYLTWRTVHVQHRRLEPHQAVNRLVLARACALVGALVAGGYVGYAVTWLGNDAELAAQRALRSGIAGAAGVAIVVTAMLLERACRVRSEGDET
jgi:MFS family permease